MKYAPANVCYALFMRNKVIPSIGEIKMSNVKRLLASVTVALLLIAGCTTPDRVVRVYQDVEYVGGPFTKVLVVGAHENADLRRRFEDSVVYYLNRSGTDAAMSIDTMGSAQELTRDTIVAAANRTGSDAVMITRVLDVDARAQVNEGRSSVAVERRNDVPIADFFRYDYATYQDPMTITTVRTVVLATDLYGLGDERRVWSVESRSIDKATIEATIDGASRALVGALGNDSLIR